jgi:tripartite-type tricarboxylate transporter receptor subunit TctC
MKRLGTLVAATAGLVLAAAPAAAQQIGKQMTIVVGFGAGGGYHNLATILSRHMGQYLPGNPTIIVQVKTGAGSLIAMNYVANVAPKDGSVLGTVSGATILEPLFGNKKARYDPRKINWIGSAASGHNTCFALTRTGITSLDAAKKKELAIGSTGRGSRTFTYPTALNTLLGTKFKIISGYRGMKDVMQAMETGEISGVCGYGWESVRKQHARLLEDKTITLFAQFAYAKHSELQDVPLVLDVVKPGRERQAIKLLSIDAYVAWPLLAPPGTPKAEVETIRRAYEKALADPALIADARKIGVGIDPIKGEEIQSVVAQAYATPDEVVEFTREITGLK